MTVLGVSREERTSFDQEMLIREARLRTRRRRLRRGAIGLVVVALGLTIWLASGGSGHPNAVRRVSGDGGSPRSANDSANSTALAVLGGQSLEKIWPVNGSTLWALTANATTLTGGGQGLELTTNGGVSWTNATPPGLSRERGARLLGAFALTAAQAWTDYGGFSGTAKRTLLYTGDAGRHWAKVGVLPAAFCVLQFVSRRDGTCTEEVGAMGSMPNIIFRTSDGGATWRKIYDDNAEISLPYSSLPAGWLPFGCDKSIQFTSAARGWALFLCNAGFAPIYETVDGGVSWTQRIATQPSPLPVGGGEFSGVPVIEGSRGAVGYTGGSYSLVYATDDGGRSFHPVYPPGRRRQWSVDVVTPLKWRLAFRNVLLVTNDAGRSWTTFTNNATRPIARLRYAPTQPAVTLTANARGWLTWFAGDGNVLMRTINDGRTWKTITVPGT